MKKSNNNISVFVPMEGDIIHPGNINIIKHARDYGSIIIGLYTDEAISKYKRVPILNYDQRKNIVLNLKSVEKVVPLKSMDFSNIIADLNLEIERNKLAKEKLSHTIKGLSEKLNEYNENKSKVNKLLMKIMLFWNKYKCGNDKQKHLKKMEKQKKQMRCGKNITMP